MATTLLKEDYKFVKATPDPGWNPDRTKAQVADCITKYELLRKKKREQFKELVGERSDVIATWATSMTGSSKPIDKYLGRKVMTQLVGEKILARMGKVRELEEKGIFVV
jgi:hypothetical protein